MKTFSMKPFLVALAATAMLGISANAAPKKADTSLSFNGEIVKSSCLSRKATRNVNALECTADSSSTHSKYVLYDPQANKVYRLSDQRTANEFAGENVRVSGIMNKTTHVLHITDITGFPEQS